MITELPVCLEVGQNYKPKAEYSIRMLLRPLGLGPKFCCRNQLEDHGIYYGHRPFELHDDVIILPMASEAEDFFAIKQKLDVTSIKWCHHSDCDVPILFSSEMGDDLIASTFYWLSGWQEYSLRTRDQHGRFPYSASLQSMLDIAQIPVVDYYRDILREQFISAQISLDLKSWGEKKWAFCPTIDVDYFNHWRLGMIFREKIEYFLLNKRKVNLVERWRRLFQFIRSYFTRGDAFQNALRQMYQLIRRYGRATIFLKTDAHGPNDVHYKLGLPQMQRMIRGLQTDRFEIGLHSSYHAYDHPEYLRKERRLLTQMIGTAPISVRNHYLRYAPVTTAHLQANAGFMIDSTLGFAERGGFRNGTCMPFLIFDCQNNQVIDLWEIPLLIMDGALFNRQKLSSEEAIAHSKDLLSQCKKFGGVGVALWHNVMGEEMDYPRWDDHFEQIIEWSHQQGAKIDSLNRTLESWLGHRL